MRQEILDYLKSQRVGILSLEMLDGSPHAAAVHFAHIESPLTFFFETDSNYRKAEPLLKKSMTRASLVIGSDESLMKTFQLDGKVELLKSQEKRIFDSVYPGKFPGKKEKLQSSKVILFKFTPTWWRFTDWANPQGKTIWTSE